MGKLEAQKKKASELDIQAREIIAQNNQMDFYTKQLEIQYIRYKIKQLAKKSDKIDEAYDVLSVATKGPKEQKKDSVLKYFRKKRKQLKFGQNQNPSYMSRGGTPSIITDNDSRAPSVVSGTTDYHDNILGYQDTSNDVSMISVNTRVD